MRLALVARFIETLAPEAVARFLEIGPGMGDVSLFLARRFPAACGDLIDFSPECTNLLRARFRDHPRLTVLDGDFRQRNVGHGYDLVVACEVFEHLDNDASAFAAVNDCLRVGGKLLLSVPAFMRKWEHGDDYAGHYRRYERNELVTKLTRSGFTIERLWCYGFPINTLLYPLHQIYYRRRLSQGAQDKVVATQRSGVDRALARRLRRLPWVLMMQPFFFCQDRFKDTDMGDGFLVLANKAH